MLLITSIGRSTVTAAGDKQQHSTMRPLPFTPDLHLRSSGPNMDVRKSLDVKGVSEDEDLSDDDEEYHSFESDTPSEESDEERELTEEEKRREHKARALERQRVMEAAGLIIKAAQGSAPPRPLRRRRTPPQTPQRQSICSITSNKDLPPTPEPETPSHVEPVLHVDDAFERYENFRKTKDYRLSVSSFDTGPPPSPVTSVLSPSLSAANSTSKEGDSRPHSIFGFLGRSRTPGSDTDRPRLQISAPIPLVSGNGNADAATPRESSPAFGSVSFTRELIIFDR